MTNSISCGFDHVWIDRMYNKQTNKLLYVWNIFLTCSMSKLLTCFVFIECKSIQLLIRGIFLSYCCKICQLQNVVFLTTPSLSVNSNLSLVDIKYSDLLFLFIHVFKLQCFECCPHNCVFWGGGGSF